MNSIEAGHLNWPLSRSRRRKKLTQLKERSNSVSDGQKEKECGSNVSKQIGLEAAHQMEEDKKVPTCSSTKGKS